MENNKPKDISYKVPNDFQKDPNIMCSSKMHYLTNNQRSYFYGYLHKIN